MTPLQPTLRSRTLAIAMVSALCLCGFESITLAQRGGFGGGGSGGSGPGGGRGGFGGRGMPTPEESFQRMDRNQNGLLDLDEIQQLPGFLKDMYARAGLDGTRAINLQEFQGVSQKLREQFEQGGGGGQFQSRRPEGSGGPPGDLRQPGGESDRREMNRSEEPADNNDFRRDRRRDDRESSSTSSSGGKDSSSSKNAKKEKKPKPRVTKDLPDEYRDKDKNGDGQIALHEWERSSFAKFFDLDRNGDGFLTPSELLPAPVKADKDKKGTSKTTTTADPKSTAATSTTTTTTSTNDASKPADSSKPAADTKSATDSSPGAVAFLSLDVNKDGQITPDEWERSRNTRRRFEKAKITVTLPIKQAQFVDLYRKTEDR